MNVNHLAESLQETLEKSNVFPIGNLQENYNHPSRDKNLQTKLNPVGQVEKPFSPKKLTSFTKHPVEIFIFRNTPKKQSKPHKIRTKNTQKESLKTPIKNPIPFTNHQTIKKRKIYQNPLQNTKEPQFPKSSDKSNTDKTTNDNP